MNRKLLLLGLLAAGVLGCQPAQRRAETALAESRYPDALVDLQGLEAKMPVRTPRWQAQYCLERGIAHLALGDVASAAHWLGRAWAWHEYDPLLLTPCDRSRLVTAWRSMGKMPGERVSVIGVASVARAAPAK